LCSATCHFGHLLPLFDAPRRVNDERRSPNISRDSCTEYVLLLNLASDPTKVLAVLTFFSDGDFGGPEASRSARRITHVLLLGGERRQAKHARQARVP
jgi:hypothetical protein